MADEKTTKVFARLTKDFPAGGTHRRGGLTLTSGPAPQEAQVTKEQLEALENDPMVELVDAKEAKKWEERLQSEPPHPSSGELADAQRNQDTGGRNYEGDGTGDDTSSEGSDDGSGDESDDGDEGQEENLAELTREQLNAKATEAGVSEPESLPNKQAVIEAIENATASGE